MNKKDKRTRTGTEIFAWIILVFAFIILALGGIQTYIDWSQTGKLDKWAEGGSRGDFWGGHLAAFSSFAGTMMLFAAFLLQKSELQLQRQELAEGRKIAHEQAKALEAQTIELNKQNEIAERKDDIDLIISLAKQVRESAHISVTLCNPIIRLALIRIVDRARKDSRLSLELFDVFSKGTAWPHGMDDFNTILDEVLQMYAPDIYENRDGGWNDWLLQARILVNPKKHISNKARLQIEEME